MITYEVTAVVEERLTDRFERYMRQTHIPEVLATGCFQAAVFARASLGRYRTGYFAMTQADLDRYLESHTAGLWGDFAAHFPAGVSLSREVWVTLERWEGASPAQR